MIDRSKNLRKSVYKIDEKMKSKFPSKVSNGLLEDQITYCQKLIRVIESNEIISNAPIVKEKINLLKESIEDDLEQLYLSNDCDAKVGHKTADTAYFGYKTHLAMTEERIITAAVVTSGEKHDGKQLTELIEKSVATGMKIQDIVGDMAYSEKDNLDYADEKKLNLISKLSKTVTHGNSRVNKNKFEYNKDADMYVKQVIWLLKKQVLDLKNMLLMEMELLNLTFLILKNVRFAVKKMVAIKMVQIQNHAQYL